MPTATVPAPRLRNRSRAKKLTLADAPKHQKPLEDPKAEPLPVKKPDKKEERQLRCLFTNTEMLELGKKAAELANLRERQQEDAKAVVKQLKAKVDATEALLAEVFGKMTTGYEYRQIICTIQYDKPAIGKKTIVRMDTLETVEVEQMGLSELQAELPLAPSAPTPAPELPNPVLPAGTTVPTVKAEAPGVVSVPSDNPPKA